MQAPGAIAQSGAPMVTASSFCAQYSIVPQLMALVSPRPRNSRPAAARTE